MNVQECRSIQQIRTGQAEILLLLDCWELCVCDSLCSRVFCLHTCLWRACARDRKMRPPTPLLFCSNRRLSAWQPSRGCCTLPHSALGHNHSIHLQQLPLCETPHLALPSAGLREKKKLLSCVMAGGGPASAPGHGRI